MAVIVVREMGTFLISVEARTAIGSWRNGDIPHFARGANCNTAAREMRNVPISLQGPVLAQGLHHLAGAQLLAFQAVIQRRPQQNARLAADSGVGKVLARDREQRPA